MSFRILYYFLTVVVWSCVLGIVDKGSYSVSRCRSLRYCRILKRRKQTEETKTVPRRCVSITDNGHYFLLITFKGCCLKPKCVQVKTVFMSMSHQRCIYFSRIAVLTPSRELSFICKMQRKEIYERTKSGQRLVVIRAQAVFITPYTMLRISKLKL